MICSCRPHSAVEVVAGLWPPHYCLIVQRILASWFGSGLVLGRVRGSDAGSGTVGSLVAFPLGWWLGSAFGWQAQLGAAVAVTLLSLWASRPFAADHADPGWIVIDEAAGTLFAMIGLTLVPAIFAFVVFRVADITKKLPGVGQAERLPGAGGITFDDVIAGLWALGAGWLLQAFL